MPDTLAIINLTNVQFLSNTPLLSAVQTAPQTVTTSTITALTWPTPSVDTYTGWAAGSPTRYTAKYPGYYRIVGSVAFASNATGSRSVAIRMNGVATDLNQVTTQANGFNTVLQVESIQLFNGSTDYFEVYVDQSSGGNLNTVVTLTSVTAQWIHV